MSRRHLRPVVAVAAAVMLALTACGSDENGADAAQQTTSAPPPPPMTAAELDAAVEEVVTKIERADKRLSDCEAGVAGYGFNTCWERTKRTFNRADDLVALLKEQGPPATHVTLLTEAERFASVRGEVSDGCSTGNDQTCDTALMTYRTELQDLLWAVP